MGRLEAIQKRAAECFPYDTEGTQTAFIEGAKWADENPRIIPGPAPSEAEKKLEIALAEIDYFISRVESKGPDHVNSKRTYARFIAARKKILG